MSKEKILKKLKEYNQSYRNGNPKISDEEYDSLKESINDPDLLLFENKGNVKHPCPIGSLKKHKQFEDIPLSLKNFVSAKIDGLSMVLHFKNGKLILAATRGDGYFGIDQTEKIQKIIPALKESFSGIVRGEVIIKKSKGINYKKNLRNIAVGIINRKEITPEIENLSFIAYEILETDLTKIEQFRLLERIGFEVAANDVIGNNVNELSKTLKFFRDSLDYNIDGLVCCDFNQKSEPEILPKNIYAYKENYEGIFSTVRNIVWNVSKNGLFKPVIIIDPIEIDGSIVKRITGNNYQWILDHNVAINSQVRVIKSGEIIPKILEVKNENHFSNINVPTICPECGSKLEILGKELVCNNKNCGLGNTKRVFQFLLNCEVQFVAVKSLENWNIESLEELLDFANKKESDLQGVVQRKFWNELQEKVLNLSLNELIVNYPFKGLGKKIVEKLLKDNQCDQIVNIKCLENLKEVKGVGSVLLQKFFDDLPDLKNFLNHFNQLFGRKVSEITIVETPKSTNSDSLNGYSFVITGTLSKPRKEFENLIKENGGELKGSVTKGLDFLIIGVNPGSKLEKAKSLNINIINEKDFLNLLKI